MGRPFPVLPLLFITVLWGGWLHCPTVADHHESHALYSGKEMGVKQALYMPVLLILSQMSYRASAQQCNEAKHSKYGMMLRRHIFRNITGVSHGGLCLQECLFEIRCQSFNYVISQYMCELNNRTKEARPEDFVPNYDRYYFRRDWNRVPLGSIPELPAESCKEIKASEGRQAASGKYWFDSIIPEETVHAHCDMENEAAPQVKAIHIHSNCSGTSDMEKGIIKTPNYPKNYDDNICCWWLISSLHRVKLVFTSFYLEGRYDFLHIHDGTSDSASCIDKYDGNRTGHVVESSGEHLFLKFTTDGSITKQGFELNFEAVP